MTDAAGTATEELKALGPSIANILNALRLLAEAQTEQSREQSRVIEQQAVIVGKLGQVVVQLNKHSLFLTHHERALARCLGCQNYKAADPNSDTAAWDPEGPGVIR